VGKIGEAIGSIGEKIMDGIGSLVDSAAQWGRDMIDNFIGGIKSMWDKAKNAVSDFAGMVKDFLGFSEPEEGPLSNFHTYAPDMMKLFAEGIEQNKGMIADAIDGAFSFGPSITGNMAGQGETYKVSRGGENGGRNIVIPIMIDGREFARAEVPYIEAEQNRVGIRLSGGYA
jgi:phage-related protein